MKKILLVAALISLVFGGLSVAQAASVNCGGSPVGVLDGYWGEYTLTYPTWKGDMTLTDASYCCAAGVVEIILSTKDINAGSSWGTFSKNTDRIVKTIGIGSTGLTGVPYDACLPVGSYAFDILVPLKAYTPGSGARMYIVYNRDWVGDRTVIQRTGTF